MSPEYQLTSTVESATPSADDTRVQTVRQLIQVHRALHADLGLFLNSELPLGELTGYAFGGYTSREIETPFVFRAPLDKGSFRYPSASPFDYNGGYYYYLRLNARF